MIALCLLLSLIEHDGPLTCSVICVPQTLSRKMLKKYEFRRFMKMFAEATWAEAAGRRQSSHKLILCSDSSARAGRQSLRRFSTGRSVVCWESPAPSSSGVESPRLSVGRFDCGCPGAPSSSVEEGVEEGRRLSVGRLFGPSVACRALLTETRRDLTAPNSEVLIAYSCLSGKRATSFCTSVMRSPVIGCVLKTFAIAPGFFFSRAWSFSKKLTIALGS